METLSVHTNTHMYAAVTDESSEGWLEGLEGAKGRERRWHLNTTSHTELMSQQSQFPRFSDRGSWMMLYTENDSNQHWNADFSKTIQTWRKLKNWKKNTNCLMIVPPWCSLWEHGSTWLWTNPLQLCNSGERTLLYTVSLTSFTRATREVADRLT